MLELEAELESLRKPLDGELADVATLRGYLLKDTYPDYPGGARPAKEALDRIESALRAKGEPESRQQNTVTLVAVLDLAWTRTRGVGWSIRISLREPRPAERAR